MAQRERRLDSTILDRLSVRPGWTRTALFRRIAAGLLAASAVVLFVRESAASGTAVVLVAARDLASGHIIDDADVTTIDFEPATVPHGVLGAPGDAVGRTIAGPVRAGEPITDVRVLGPRLATAALGGRDARVVPIRLADASVTELLHEGDSVDILTVDETTERSAPSAKLLAQDAKVVLVSPKTTGQGRDRVVLVALPPEGATTVAAASLVSALTVTLR